MTDIRPGFRGYRSVGGALRKIGRAGLAATIAELAQQQGYGEIKPAFAQRGDVMLIEGDRDGFDATVGIRIDGGIAIASTTGFAIEPWQRASRAWRVS